MAHRLGNIATYLLKRAGVADSTAVPEKVCGEGLLGVEAMAYGFGVCHGFLYVFLMYVYIYIYTYTHIICSICYMYLYIQKIYIRMYI